ncbi:hypothetical protein LRY65_02280 [Candidatus Woesebacteria bacterium]|nr:hypothetical protein [Candidatus Woesebacteria bacterium]MCD8507294.1 hypothetical protein [Candidatus Woesebacteria bacterium]MCD8527020.1 hypothetical protein [Candidatus Woesebacteria bacterium]MCD8546743.1 hypothetical protein [Candidatus Woesebacteria bacterium]
MAASSRKQKSVKKSKTVAAAPLQNVSLTEARRILQNSYTMHLILLVIMTALAAFLLVVVVKQQYTIDSLDFQLRFIRKRYEYTKDWNGELLESRSAGEEADTTEDGFPFAPEKQEISE